MPTEEEINILIANAGRKYSLLLSLIRDTGMRPIEVERATVRWFDLERASVNVQTAKHGNGRTLGLKPQTLACMQYLNALRKAGFITENSSIWKTTEKGFHVIEACKLCRSLMKKIP